MLLIFLLPEAPTLGWRDESLMMAYDTVSKIVYVIVKLHNYIYLCLRC